MDGQESSVSVKIINLLKENPDRWVTKDDIINSIGEEKIASTLFTLSFVEKLIVYDVQNKKYQLGFHTRQKMIQNENKIDWEAIKSSSDLIDVAIINYVYKNGTCTFQELCRHLRGFNKNKQTYRRRIWRFQKLGLLYIPHRKFPFMINSVNMHQKNVIVLIRLVLAGNPLIQSQLIRQTNELI